MVLHMLQMTNNAEGVTVHAAGEHPLDVLVLNIATNRIKKSHHQGSTV